MCLGFFTRTHNPTNRFNAIMIYKVFSSIGYMVMEKLTGLYSNNLIESVPLQREARRSTLR